MLYLGAFTNIYVSCSAGSKHDVLYKKGSLHDKFWRSQHPPPKKFGKVVGLGKVSMAKVELSRRNQEFV